MYYTPTDRPDVEYELWQYLILVSAGAPIIALACAASVSALFSLVTVFLPGASDTDAGVGASMAAWTLLYITAAVWLTIWLGNEQPVKRSWLELLLDFAGLLGAGLIVGWHAWRAARRGKPRKRRAKESR